MNKEIKRYQTEFETIYDGEPFYGKSLMTLVRSADPDAVFNKPGESGHSTWEITQHLYAWRELLVKRLQGYKGKGIEMDSNEDWASIPAVKKAGLWNDLVKKLEKNQEELVKALSVFHDEDLDKDFAGTDYSLRTFLDGQIQHDIYHIGQIALAIKYSSLGIKQVQPLM